MPKQGKKIKSPHERAYKVKYAYCPTCKKGPLYRPNWLAKRYEAYCDKCERAYTDAELIWK